MNWLTDYLIERLTDWLTGYLTDMKARLTDWLTDWLTIWLTDWLTNWSCSAGLPWNMTCGADVWHFSDFYEDAVSKSLRLPSEKHFELQKTSRDPCVLTILTSKSFSRAGVVQILATWTSKSVPATSFFNDFDFTLLSRTGVVQILATSTSKSAPTPLFFNDFDFHITVARARGANFGDFNSQKCSKPVSF